MENQDKEIIIQLSMLEQQSRNLQQQIEMVEKNIIELNYLNAGLDDLENSGGKEIFSSLGKGIFIKSKIISENLVVDIGNGNFVTKNIKETKELIGEQIKKLEKIKSELNATVEKINDEIIKGIEKVEKINGERV